MACRLDEAWHLPDARDALNSEAPARTALRGAPWLVEAYVAFFGFSTAWAFLAILAYRNGFWAKIISSIFLVRKGKGSTTIHPGGLWRAGLVDGFHFWRAGGGLHAVW